MILSIAAPPDIQENKTEIHHLQLSDHIRVGEMACARCRLVRSVVAFYRCRFCHVWYCAVCAADHFATDQNPLSDFFDPASSG